MDKILNILNEVELSGNVPRLFLSMDEIKIFDSLVKSGYLYKSKTCEKNSTISYYRTDKEYILCEQ